MQARKFDDKQKRSSEMEIYAQYLPLPSEPKDRTLSGRGAFGFRNRYLTKRRVLRTIRRLRREEV